VDICAGELIPPPGVRVCSACVRACVRASERATPRNGDAGGLKTGRDGG